MESGQLECAVCSIAAASEDDLLLYCQRGCSMCQVCALSENVREVLFDEHNADQSETVQCMFCEKSQSLIGRRDPDSFERLCNVKFNPPKVESADEASDDEPETPSRRVAAAEASPSAGTSSRDGSPSNSGSNSGSDLDSDADSDSGSGSNSDALDAPNARARVRPRPQSAAAAKKAAKQAAEAERCTFSWVGGATLDVREDDLDAAFEQHPVHEAPPRAAYRTVATHAMTGHVQKHAELVRTRRRQRDNVRKITLKALLQDIAEVYEQWLRRSIEEEAVLDLPDFYAKYTAGFFGSKKMADAQLYAVTCAVLQFAEQSERVSTFGKVLGIVKPELYSPKLGSVLFVLLAGLFKGTVASRTKAFRECLDGGEGMSWLRTEVTEDALAAAFDGSPEWRIDVVRHDCERLCVVQPWHEGVRSSFEGNIRRLAQNPSAKGVSVAKARGLTKITDVDAFLQFAITSWMVEWMRTLAQLDRAEQDNEGRRRLEVERRERMRVVANDRAFSDVEAGLLRTLVKASGASDGGSGASDGGSGAFVGGCGASDGGSGTSEGSDGSGKSPEGSEGSGQNTEQEQQREVEEARKWRRVVELNVARQKAHKPYVVNRSVEAMQGGWLRTETERRAKETRDWDFSLWEWNEDWEWSSRISGPSASASASASAGAAEPFSKKAQLPPLVLASPGARKGLFDWSSKPLGQLGIHTLVVALAGCTDSVDVVSVRGNNVGDEEGAKLVRCISCSHRLVFLDLSRNRAGDAVAASLLEQLPTSLAALQRLDLSHNKLGRHKVGARLVRQLAKHEKITTLRLADNDIGSRPFWAATLRELASAPALCDLDLSWNLLQLADVQPLLGKLRNRAGSRPLRTLNLNLNKIGAADIDAVAYESDTLTVTCQSLAFMVKGRSP